MKEGLCGREHSQHTQSKEWKQFGKIDRLQRIITGVRSWLTQETHGVPPLQSFISHKCYTQGSPGSKIKINDCDTKVKPCQGTL